MTGGVVKRVGGLSAVAEGDKQEGERAAVEGSKP